MWYSEGKLNYDHDYEAAAAREELVDEIENILYEESNHRTQLAILLESDIIDEVVELVFKTSLTLLRDNDPKVRELAEKVDRWMTDSIHAEFFRQAERIVSRGEANKWFKSRME